MGYKFLGRCLSRWLGRARAGKELLMIILFGVTAVSTFTNVARDYLTMNQVIAVNVAFVLGVIIFIYLGDREKFFISQQRDLMDITHNFMNPETAMKALIHAEQFKLLAQHLQGRTTQKEFHEAIDTKTRELIWKYRTGIDLEKEVKQ